MSYKKLEVWQLARELSVKIHRLSLQLPKFEMYEVGSQIRRSVKSVRANIVEGYGRRRYKQEFIRFLTFAHASCDESIDHLETLFDTGSLTDSDAYQEIQEQLNRLGGKLNILIQSVESQHLSIREHESEYSLTEDGE